MQSGSIEQLMNMCTCLCEHLSININYNDRNYQLFDAHLLIIVKRQRAMIYYLILFSDILLSWFVQSICIWFKTRNLEIQNVSCMIHEAK